MCCETFCSGPLLLFHLLPSTSSLSSSSSSSSPSCRWFTHFYAWGLIWNVSIFFLYLASCIARLPSPPFTAVLGPVIRTLTGVDLQLSCRTEEGGGGAVSQKQFDVALVLCLVCAQMMRRLYECVFVSVFSPSGRMHVLHYVLGIYFYTALGPTALLHLRHGTGASDQRGASPDAASVPTTGFHWHHFAGLLLFALGSWHQYKCHKILASLRMDTQEASSHVKKHDSGGTNSNRGSYGLPQGDWFEYVSCPHYFAEVLLYLGILLVFVVDDLWTPWWLVAVFTVSTLTLSARQVHEWYKEKFEDYPETRKALFPGVY